MSALEMFAEAQGLLSGHDSSLGSTLSPAQTGPQPGAHGHFAHSLLLHSLCPAPPNWGPPGSLGPDWERLPET